LQEQKVSVFNYNQKANVDYSVVYKPNLLTNETSLEEGSVYITNYVDYINTILDYNCSGERSAKISGNFSISAVVEALEGRIDDDEPKIIWRKDFELVPKTRFSASGKEFSMKKELPVYLAPFQNFVQQIIQESKVIGNHKLTVKWEIDVEIETDKGIVKDNLTPTLIIPLGNNYFEIGGEPTVEKPESIEEVIKVESPRKRNGVIIFSVLDVLSLLTLIIVLTCTAGADTGKVDR